MRVPRIETSTRFSPGGVRALRTGGALFALLFVISPAILLAQGEDRTSQREVPRQEAAEVAEETLLQNAARRAKERQTLITDSAPAHEGNAPRAASVNLEQLRRQHQELQLHREVLAAEVELLRAESELAGAAGGGLPATNRAFKVFALKNVQAPEVARICHEVLSPGKAQIAVDERTNSLVVSTDELTIIAIEQLINAIDKPGAATGTQNEATETVRLRIVWVLDGLPEIPGDGRLPQPVSEFLNEDVARSLEDIGFRSPAVVAQQISTLTLNQTRETPFQFSVPVLVTGEVWQFQGSGHLRGRTGDDDYWLQFGLQIKQPNSSQQSQLMGSMVTPRGHYAILGTSTFVAPGPPRGEGDGGGAGGFGTVMENSQYQSAFVVYLDRARSVPASPDTRDATQPRRE